MSHVPHSHRYFVFVLATSLGLAASWLSAEAACAAEAPGGTIASLVKVPPEFTTSLYAAPPEIGYPACLCAAPDGTLYVGIDENGSIDRAKDRGRIVRCRDKDDDGKADEFVEFCKLDSPRGVVWDIDRLYVLHPPKLDVYFDENGDGKAERSETLVDGIGFDLNFRGADHTTNGIRLGIDGFLYVAVGDYGFVKATGRDGRELQLRGGGVVRVRTDGTGLEIVSRGQRNIYDVAIDPLMNLFTRDNTNDGGGWNVRVSHVVPGGNYGYPRLFTNFPDEIVPAMIDVGGGSPCGALCLDEPQAFPEPYGRGLYTVEWGRNMIVRQPLTASGATFTTHDEPLFHLPRPTDMDVDARGNLYVSSWKDGGFTYSGPAVGFIVRIRSSDRKPLPAPDFQHASDGELRELIGSSSGVIRQAAQRELVRRPNAASATSSLVALAEKSPDLAVRTAVVFTLAQIRDPLTREAIVKLGAYEDLQVAAITALGDRLADEPAGPQVVSSAAYQGLNAKNPRTRLAAARVMGKLGRQAHLPRLIEHVADPDPIVAHVAIESLVELGTLVSPEDSGKLEVVGHCFGTLDRDTTSLQTYAACCRALQRLHNPQVVDGLLARLERTTTDEAKQKMFLAALCRLANKEDMWDGKWWGTRPDTRGPYYSPVAWSETPRILAALESVRGGASDELRLWLTIEELRNRITPPNAAGDIIRQAERDSKFRLQAISILGQLPDRDLASEKFLLQTATTTDVPAGERAAAYAASHKRISPANYATQLAAFAQIGIGSAVEPLQNVRNDFLSSAFDPRYLPEVVAAASSNDSLRRRFALNMLLNLTQDAKAKNEARNTANAAIENAWKQPASTVDLLYAIASADADGLADRVQALRKSDEAAIRTAADYAAKELRLDERAKDAKTIAQFAFDDVQAKLSTAKGDAKRGAKLFVKQGCVNCHSVSQNEPSVGPFLGGIAARYNRNELIESVLKPSQKIAQGFETQYFVTDDGQVFEGFVVRESGEEVELRNANGVASTLKKKAIEDRGRRELSIMPTGLADRLTLDDLAGLLAYLESLPNK